MEYDPKNPHAGGGGKAAASRSPASRAKMSQRSRTNYLQQQAQRRVQREQEEWRDNFDRNDDPLYHRSFDDGSMHLVSSAFRDGKPVDNHGKDAGGYGRGGPVQYRRTAMKSTVEGETATFVPLGETNNTLRYFAATQTKEHERGWSGLRGAAPWDSTSYKAVPYTLRGLKIQSNEAWVGEVGHNPETMFATSCLSRLDDGSRDTVVDLFNRRKEENDKVAANRGLLPWHSSPVLWRWPRAQPQPPAGHLHDEWNAAEEEEGYYHGEPPQA